MGPGDSLESGSLKCLWVSDPAENLLEAVVLFPRKKKKNNNKNKNLHTTDVAHPVSIFAEPLKARPWTLAYGAQCGETRLPSTTTPDRLLDPGKLSSPWPGSSSVQGHRHLVHCVPHCVLLEKHEHTKGQGSCPAPLVHLVPRLVPGIQREDKCPVKP